MIQNFINYTVLSYNKTVNTVLLIYNVICCLKLSSAKYSIYLFNIINTKLSCTLSKLKQEEQKDLNFEKTLLCIIPKWIYWNQENYYDISFQKLEYIVKSSLYINLDSELDMNMNFINKYCNNKLCQKKLAKYDTWYCYDGYAYCCPNCRLQFIENVRIKEHINPLFTKNNSIMESSKIEKNVGINI